MTLTVSDAPRVVVEARGADGGVRIQTRVSERVRTEARERIAARVGERLEAREAIEEQIERMVRPAIYVDGVLVEPSASFGDLDPSGIRSVTVTRGSNRILIESTSR